MVNIIRGERYKYVHFATLPALLFDLQNDPHEFNNVAQDPAYQTVMIEYATKLLNWRIEYDHPALSDLHIQSDGKVVHGMLQK